MRPRREVLESGLRVITVPVRDARTVTAIVFVAAGSKYETVRTNGISHFLEHLCFKGTERYPSALALSHAFDELGAENNAFTAEEYTGYYAKADPRHLEAILALVADVYLNATLPAPDIERERGVVTEEINLYSDQPTWHAEDLITDLLYGDQPAGWEVLGTKENIRSLSRDDIVRYRKAHYVGSGTTVVVVGDVAPASVTRKVRELFGGISREPKAPKPRVVERQRAPKVGVRYRKTDQAHLVFGMRTVPFSHRDVWPLALLATVLGSGMSSRLFTRLREELGLCYYVSASHRLFTDHGYLAIRAGVTKRRVAEVIREVTTIVRSLREELVPARELEKAKSHHTGAMYLSLETTDALAWSYGVAELLGRGAVLTPAARARRIRSVTAPDIRRVARRYLTDERLNLAVVGPYRDAHAFERVLHL